VSVSSRLGSTAPTPPLRRCGGNLVLAWRLLRQPVRFRGAAWPLDVGRILVLGCAGLAVFFICMFFLDAPAADWARALPQALRSTFSVITDFGKSGWFLWPLGVLFIALAAAPVPATRLAQGVLAVAMVRTGFLFFAIAVPGIFVNIVKHLFGRARPFVTGIADAFVFVPFSWPAAYASLPSGHGATAASVLVAFGALWPRARALLWIYALVIFASRVIVNAHYPSDVVAGAVVGAVGAIMVRRYFALRRLGFSVGPDGAVHALAGPSWRRLKAVARNRRAP